MQRKTRENRKKINQKNTSKQNMTKQELKSKKGVTLIALVVTIVILLILAGVSINLVLGDNGIIIKSKEAKRETVIGQEKEIITLAYAGIKMGNNDVTLTALENEINKVKNSKVSIVLNIPENSIFIENGQKNGSIYKIEMDYTYYMYVDTEKIEDIDFSTMEGVAAIGTTVYETLQLAINAVPERELTVINLLKNTNEDVETLENQEIILNLRGYSINNLEDSTFITSSGNEIQIMNGSIYNSGEYRTIEVVEDSKLSISNVEISKAENDSYMETVRSLWRI